MTEARSPQARLLHPAGAPADPGYADVLREDRDAVVLADRLGYREAFIGEHLVDAAETITSSLAFIAHMADACPSITFGTGVLPLANYHPAMAAAHVAMVDHLVQGRLVLGIGPGVPGDAEAIGDLGTDRKRKTQEAIEHMLRIWSEDPPYRIAGDFYQTTTERSFNRQIGVGIAVRPLQRPHPPIAITSIRPTAPARRRREAAAGPASPPPTSAPTSSGRISEGYLQGRRSAGLSADPSGWRVARSVFVADDEATAREYAHRADGAHGFYFHVMRTKLASAGLLDVMRDHPGQSDAELSPRRCLERLVIAGTPERVAEQILAFRRLGRCVRHAPLHGPRLERSRARAAFHGADVARGPSDDQSRAGRLSVDIHRSTTAS